MTIASQAPVTPNESGLRLHVRHAGSGESTWVQPGGTLAQGLQWARREGLQVLAFERGDQSDGARPTGETLRQRGGRFDLLLFSQELLALLNAGLTLTEALPTLRAKARPGKESQVLDHIVDQLRCGRTFSQALGVLPRSPFPEVYVATVRSAERTGDLPRALERFVLYQRQFDTMRKKVIAALLYPAMLVLVGTFVVMFLLGFVVPRFAGVYEASGREMPLLSQWMLAAGLALRTYGPYAVPAAMVGAWLLAQWVRASGAGAQLTERLLLMPGIAQQSRLFRMGRFYRALGLLMSAGIPLTRAIELVEGLLGPVKQRALAGVRRLLEEGQVLSKALSDHGLSSPVADSLIKVGERSGQLADMLERTASFHDEEVSRWLDWTSRLLEPVLMLAIGLIIGTVVILMYLPIFDLAGSFGQ